MTDFGYKVTLEAPCGAKRFAAFHTVYDLAHDDVEIEACQHVSSQTCPRCDENHDMFDFHVVNVVKQIY